MIWHSKRYPRKDFGQLASYQSNHALAYRIHYRLESVLYQLAPLPYRVNHLGGKVSMSSACLPDRGTSVKNRRDRPAPQLRRYGG